jgi:hypothetical protein
MITQSVIVTLFLDKSLSSNAAIELPFTMNPALTPAAMGATIAAGGGCAEGGSGAYCSTMAVMRATVASRHSM